MKRAEEEVLGDYLNQTEAILQNMGRERDIIRAEAAKILELKRELETGAVSRLRRDKPMGGEKKTPLATRAAVFIAWSFFFAGANELMTAYNAESGLTTIVEIKVGFDMVIAAMSTYIATRRNSKA